jgi:uncharacterized membrane protein
MLIIHFIGLAMGIGTGFAHAFLGSVAAKMDAKEATKFRLHTLVLTKMGNVGITFLVISGLGLMTPYWKILPSSPLLIVKLSLVFLLAIVIFMLNVLGKKARQGNPEEQLGKMQTLGKISMVLGLSIVIVAVSFFH